MAKEQSLIIKIAGKVDPTLKSALGVVNSGIKGAGRLMASATAAGIAAVGAIGAASIKVGKEFESSMSSLAATAGIDSTSEAYAQLEDAARKMGRETTKTAAEAADALNYMALAGWDTETSCAALEPVLRLSEATELDLATTSDLVTDSMSAMGLSVDELSNYLDVCAAANNSSNQSAQQLMEAMIGCGGAARSAGMDFGDTATALGILANNGIKGSEAGTALNSMLVRISTNSSAASAFKELGVAVYDSEGSMRDLQDILVDTSAALDGMTDAQKNSYLSAIAGKAYYSDFQYLLNGVSDDVDGLGSSWDQLSGQLENCDGALEAMAATKTDNLQGDLSRLTSAASDLGISIYQGINGPLREITQLGADMMSQLGAAFDEGGFTGMAGALGSCLSQMLNTLVGYLPDLVSMGVQVIGSLISGIGESAPQIAQSAATALTQFIVGAAQIFPQIASTGIQVILSFVQAMIPQMPLILQAATTGIMQFVIGVLVSLPQILETGIQLVTSMVQGILQALPMLVQMAAAGIMQFIQGLIINLPVVLQMGVDLILTLVQGVLDALPEIIKAAIELVGALIDTIFHTDWIAVGAQILDIIGNGLIGGIADAFGGFIDGVKDFFSGGGGQADVSSEGEAVTDSYAEGINRNRGAVTDAVTETTASAFMDIDLSSISTAGVDSMTAFSDSLLDSMPLITSAGNDMTTELTGAFDSGWDDINSGAMVAMNEMTSTLSTEATTAANAVKQAFEGMTITIPKPKIPVITTSYRTETYGEGGSIQIPQFSVSWNKLGGILDGIFTDPTVLATSQGLQGVGEAGPEAILPLDTLWDKMQDILSDVLRGGNGSVIDSLLAKLDNASGNQAELAGGGSINYSPVFNLYGSAGKEEVMEAEKMSQAEFDKMLDRHDRQTRRTRF